MMASGIRVTCRSGQTNGFGQQFLRLVSLATLLIKSHSQSADVGIALSNKAAKTMGRTKEANIFHTSMLEISYHGKYAKWNKYTQFDEFNTSVYIVPLSA